MKKIGLAYGALCTLALLVAGCATVTKGTSQAIAVASQPDGAECALTRASLPLGKVTTPGSITVKRDADPISVLCKKDGYEDGRAVMNARTESATYGNIILGGAIGSMIDASSGANNRYDSSVTIELTALSPADQAAQAARPKEPPAPAVAPDPTPGSQAYPLGAQYHDSVTVGPRNVPLPEGEWTLVSASGAVSSKGKSGLIRMYLAQMEGNRLARWIYLKTNSEWNPAGWKREKEICDRTNVHAGYSDQNNNLNDAACWVLNHYGSTLSSNPSQAAIDFYRWSDGRGRPNTSLALAYFFAKKGDTLEVIYHFNPVVAGFPDTPTAAWKGSPWHVDVASKDAKKLEYLRTLKAAGEAYFARLKLVLN